jgi:hypothetical protein
MNETVPGKWEISAETTWLFGQALGTTPEFYNARGHKLRILTLEKAQFVTATGIAEFAGQLRSCPFLPKTAGNADFILYSKL